MKTLITVGIVIYAVIIILLGISFLFDSLGILIFLSIVSTIAFLFLSYFLYCFFRNKYLFKKAQNLQLTNLLKKQKKLVKFSKLIPFVYNQTLIQLFSIATLLGDKDFGKEALKTIKIKSLRDKDSLISYFLTTFQYSLMMNDLSLFDYYSNSFRKIIDTNTEVERLLTNYQKILRMQHKEVLTDAETVDEYFASLYNKDKSNYNKLFMLYANYLCSVNDNKEFRFADMLLSLSKDTYLLKYINLLPPTINNDTK